MVNVSHGDRIQSVDTFRVLAIFAVVVIHTTPFVRDLRTFGTEWDLALVLNQLARFAVPYFFLISGYFWATKIAHASSVRKPTMAMFKRVAVILFAWSLIYLLPM
jgi:surface polysaccharide O-acyltransferase-like enzyme